MILKFTRFWQPTYHLPPTEPRYVLNLTSVVSQNDGEVHNVSAPRLAALYGLRLSDQDVIAIDRNITADLLGYRPRHGDIQLFTRKDGSYFNVRTETDPRRMDAERDILLSRAKHKDH